MMFIIDRKQRQRAVNLSAVRYVEKYDDEHILFVFDNEMSVIWKYKSISKCHSVHEKIIEALLTDETIEIDNEPPLIRPEQI